MTAPNSPPGPLDGLRVLDLAGPIGWYSAKLLTDLGADVLRVEPPTGDPARLRPPFAGDIVAPDRSLPFWWFNAGKRSVTLDLQSSVGKASFRALADEADVVIETLPVGELRALGLDYDSLAATNPKLIMTSVTPFGQTGPYATWRGCDLIGAAMGGLMHLSGCPWNAPSQPGGDQAYLQAGIVAAAATLIALRERRRSGRGQHVDVSMMDAMVFTNENAIALADLMGLNRQRLGNKAFTGPQLFYRTQDGWVAVWLGGRWDGFLRMIDALGGDSSRFADPVWLTPGYRERHVAEVNAAIAELAAKTTKATLTELLQKQRIAAAPVATVADLMRDTQLSARSFWFTMDQPLLDGSTITTTMPGPPFRMSRSPWQVRGPAPLPREHTGAGWRPRPDPPPPSAPDAPRALPLTGVRVVDLSWQIAGPGATQVLADHGAEVFKIESETHPDGLRLMQVPRPPFTDSKNQSGIYALVNTSKQSVMINMKTPAGRSLLKRLIARADVIVDNYGVDPMPKWGLTADALHAINPRLIIARSSVMGRSGPFEQFVGFGYTIGAAAGLNALTGQPDDPPVGTCTAHPDYSSNSYHLLIAILAALEHRDRTGEGQIIDLSQHESTVVFNGAAILDFSVNGRVAGPTANADPLMFPHGAFRCRGEDRWVAIACLSDANWPSLARAIERPDLADDPTLATMEGRRANAERVNAAITEWTSTRTPQEAAIALQLAGVAAGPVNDASDLLRDPHLAARGKFVRVRHPEMGWTTLNGPSFRLSATPGSVLRHPPLLGQDTEEVLRAILDIDEEELVNLYIEEVLQ
ncbi:MAG: CoA transferase, partial [Dehalococcoidia bacterium]|nr:CoA transferase [Dehalococcoidia bacterium]